MQVPFNDLSRSTAALWEHARDRIDAIVGSGRVVLGANVQEFESAFAAYLGGGHVVGVASGTDALELALRGLGVESGSRVALAANAGYYTSTALQAIGALPVFLDIAEGRATPDLAAVQQCLEAERPDVLVVTHLYGVACPDIEQIAATCRTAGASLLEDCSQSHGARRAGRMTGTFGDAAAFSFYPTKNLGALGDGGAVVTATPELAARVAALRQYGWSEKYVVGLSGGRNSRLDEIQAAVLLAALEGLDRNNARRREIVGHYRDAVPGVDFVSVDADSDAWVGHLCVIAVDDRDAVRAALGARGVATDVHFPVPDHLQPVRSGGPAPALPSTEAASARILSLPCFPAMTDAEVAHVATALREVLG